MVQFLVYSVTSRNMSKTVDTIFSILIIEQLEM